MAAAVASPHVVHTTLNYMIDPGKDTIPTYYPGTASDKRRPHDARPVDVTDIRGRESEFSLDRQGFQVIQGESVEKTFDDDERIKRDYYPECANLMKQATGASYVKAVSHIVRKRAFEDAKKSEAHLSDTDRVDGAATQRSIHVDQSYHGAETRIRDYFPEEEIDRLTKTRWAIVNLWRPFGHPASREPLAMCDARSVLDSDLRALRGILPASRAGTANYLNQTGGSVIELWNVIAGNGDSKHKWYYCSQLRPDEALLVKQFDSKKDGRARRVPHSAFVSEEDQGPPRKSVEVRCLVFWEDQERE